MSPDASVAVVTGPRGTSKHPCSRCGQQFWFASRKPEPGWVCGYCTHRTTYAAAMDERGADQMEREQWETER